VARVTSGKLLLRKQRVALDSVVEAAVETSRPALESAGHRLAMRLPPEAVMLDADPTRLAQVLANLLNNAAKYTPPGGTVELAAEIAGSEVLIAVTDNGIGFPPELAEHIFEPFAQWAPAEQGSTGLGIGLSLVRGIVALHGGSVRAASSGAGKGSRFEVRLPSAGAETFTALRASPSATAAPPGMRILVADDNRDAADALCRILALYGYEVRTAYDGDAAIASARTFRPHVAVLDIGMPARNGYEVARALRELGGAGLKLIALTGWGSAEDMQRARNAGFDHHVTKPVDPAALSELITRR